MTDEPTKWTYKLPKILDKDGDPVQLSVKMGAASLFVEFDP